MSSDDLNDFFDNLFDGNGGGMKPPPPPEPEDILEEALKACNVHIVAFESGQEKPRNPEYFKMLPIWLGELEHYLPILESFEEYEQCSLVFKTIKDIKQEQMNLELIQSLNDLDIDLVIEDTASALDQLDSLDTPDDEPDF